MTEPRRHIPGQTVLITRRTILRQFLLRPDDFINQAIKYEVAKAADRYDVEIHGAVAMSNHVHFVVTDNKAKRSDFMRDAMGGIARSRNDVLGRYGKFWAGGPYGDTVVLDENAVQRKLLYTWMNPVKAGLVERVEDWPGFMILPKHWGKKMTVKVPGKYYGRNSPKTVEFTPQPPPEYRDKPLGKVRKYFEDLIAKEEEKYHKEHPDRVYKGAQRVMADNPESTPSTKAPRNRLNPRFACTDKDLLEIAQLQRRQFLDAYETARQRWLKGKQATFPCGTVQLRKQAPIRCSDPGEHEPLRIGFG